MYQLVLIVLLSFGVGQNTERETLNRIVKQGISVGRDVSAWAGENVFVRARQLKRWTPSPGELPERRRQHGKYGDSFHSALVALSSWPLYA
jgi:hypothetical protein